MKENEGNINKNIIVRTIENNKTLKYAGLTTAGVALLEVLVKGDSLSPDNQVRVVAIAALSVVVGALGSILDMSKNS